MRPDGPATVDQLIIVYDGMAAQLDADFAFSRDAAFATSTRVSVATFKEHWDARVRPLVTRHRALRDLAETVDARLTVMETTLERQPVRPHGPPQDLHENSSTSSPVDQHVLVIPPEPAGTPLADQFARLSHLAKDRR